MEHTSYSGGDKVARVTANHATGVDVGYSEVGPKRALDPGAFLVTYLVKLPPSRLLGSQRDSFVARCRRTMTYLGKPQPAPPTPFSFGLDLLL